MRKKGDTFKKYGLPKTTLIAALRLPQPGGYGLACVAEDSADALTGLIASCQILSNVKGTPLEIAMRLRRCAAILAGRDDLGEVIDSKTFVVVDDPNAPKA